MDILLKIWNEYVLTPFFLVWVALAVLFLVVRRWLHFRAHRRTRAEQVAALTPLANSIGGRVIGPGGETTAWSAGVRGPVVEHVEGLFATLLRRSKPQFDLAMDVQRGHWHVRVTEASVRVSNPSGYGVKWVQEHRIEVATARMAPMRIIRPYKHTSTGNPLSPQRIEEQREGWVARPPSTAQSDHGGWHQVPLAPPMDGEFFACSTDPAAASRELNFDALHWLIDREGDLPVFASKMRLTFEAGFVYLVMIDHIEPDQVMVVVDTICGLLDRMPGARPRHPAAAL
ncbi:hypothetical protein UK23_37210 [Lentzea aerocolonigenes]|uniref:DUF3137 domain-containing protein n=1 Tax=Lentzea aerocolonigenes TaxID=68170 RepID=A0A0F0GGI5_LENAE|nr:hypothetical protein [Lentzea aerocolonigenes]KJK42445.1 hypothetical protein UK23_37210 [Lentzea aerocolonigenes]